VTTIVNGKEKHVYVEKCRKPCFFFFTFFKIFRTFCKHLLHKRNHILQNKLSYDKPHILCISIIKYDYVLHKVLPQYKFHTSFRTSITTRPYILPRKLHQENCASSEQVLPHMTYTLQKFTNSACLQNTPYNMSVYEPVLYHIHQVTLRSHKFSRPYSYSDC